MVGSFLRFKDFVKDCMIVNEMKKVLNATSTSSFSAQIFNAPWLKIIV